MRVFQSLLLLIPAAIADFVPGGSFGRPTIGPYNNCSGELTSRPTDLAIDTLPNISPDSPSGWERWDLTMYQDGLFLSMRWRQGDPASSHSVPAHGTFELVAKFANGTSYRTHTSGHKLTFTNETLYSISIAGNTLSWDESQTWFNTTLNVNGLIATFGSESIMLDKFSPYAGWIIGQLTENLFCGIPMTRGYTHVGSIRFPWGQEIPLEADSILNHMFSLKPIQSLATNYAIRVFRSFGTDFEDAFIHESSRAPNTSQYEAFFLGRAETRGSSFEPYTFFAGTNSGLLTTSEINTTSTNAQLAGCAHTNNAPFSWNYTIPNAHIAEYTDSAGGKTRYYITNAVASDPFANLVSQQNGMGIVEIYEALGAGFEQNIPALGGEQPQN
ncbi:hypothetical protein PAXRUDRAFT_830427 [Paxillus rubicundulus Ve08.2h10]|uniref:Uncharacterized protein n=1 Tax=Paxillus rubicundulus Ve08.2h10 TaxID=930991 RepID=A0A0D0DL20_9AGAM|nr:hypothetical protein PAXRUDRAFT_830427 [Paxillus rubicundulus Ve08.2h10]